MRRWIRFTPFTSRSTPRTCVPTWTGPVPQPRPEPYIPPTPPPDRRVKTVPVAPRDPVETGPVRFLMNRRPAPFDRPAPARQAGNHRRSLLGRAPARHAGHRRGQQWALTE